MAETQADPATEADAETGSVVEAEGEAPRIGIEAQYIKDLSFENPMGAAASGAIQKSPQITIEVTTSARQLSEGRYEVCLILHGKAAQGDAAVFIVELTYAGVIALANVPDNAVQAVLLIEGARLLFPFARNIVADVTRDGGFPPLFLQPIDFMQLYRDQHAEDGEFDGSELNDT